MSGGRLAAPAQVASAAGQFCLDGRFAGAVPHGNGHINDTWLVAFEDAGIEMRVILQRINHAIFKDPPGLMANIQRVTEHIAAHVAGDPERSRRALTLVPARDGQCWHRDAEGDFWRMYRFIERVRAYDEAETPEQAFQAAYAFGEFQRQLATLPPPRLYDTIPDFHNTPKRLADFERSLEADAANRAVLAREEIDFAWSRQTICRVLLDANLPERITHNDTKINNVLLDERTGRALCVTDLDTVMPGLAPYDFGDMVRTGTSPVAEDTLDLSRVTLQLSMYEALLHGYLSAAGSFLTGREKDCLAVSGKLISYEMGLRFLADYLAGDVYYKIHRPSHNLDRARTQFKLVESMERQEEEMHRLVERVERGESF